MLQLQQQGEVLNTQMHAALHTVHLATHCLLLQTLVVLLLLLLLLVGLPQKGMENEGRLKDNGCSFARGHNNFFFHDDR